MCGIAGCYQQADGHELTGIMTDRIAHRGPDASGVWSHRTTGSRSSSATGGCRSSTCPPPTDQPLSKGGLTIVYNGELYNYRELRKELASHGVSFVTSSDTEVVLEAWRHWGPASLPRFRGMFAFALADESTGELFLARDPLGVKPLFYLRRGEGALFASELKALVSAVGPELRIEPGALVASMLYYWVPEQFCAIEGVRSSPPASGRGCARTDAERRALLADRGRGPTRPAGPAADLGRVDRGVGRRPPGRRRAGVQLPVRRPGFQHRHRAGAPRRGRSGRLHDHLPPEDQRLEAMPDNAVYARKVAAQFG